MVWERAGEEWERLWMVNDSESLDSLHAGSSSSPSLGHLWDHTLLDGMCAALDNYKLFIFYYF